VNLNRKPWIVRYVIWFGIHSVVSCLLKVCLSACNLELEVVHERDFFNIRSGSWKGYFQFLLGQYIYIYIYIQNSKWFMKGIFSAPPWPIYIHTHKIRSGLWKGSFYFFLGQNSTRLRLVVLSGNVTSFKICSQHEGPDVLIITCYFVHNFPYSIGVLYSRMSTLWPSFKFQGKWIYFLLRIFLSFDVTIRVRVGRQEFVNLNWTLQHSRHEQQKRYCLWELFVLVIFKISCHRFFFFALLLSFVSLFSPRPAHVPCYWLGLLNKGRHIHAVQYLPNPVQADFFWIFPE
jgi:hypothetical protein